VNYYLIEPRDSLIVRDGKPFDSTPGSRANTLDFPFPSTIIGATRTRAGLDTSGEFDKTKISSLLEHRLFGPLLVQLSAPGEVEDWLIPAPSDALMIDRKQLYKLEPFELKEGENSSLSNLLPVGLEQDTNIKGKPEGMPAFWYWSHFKAWLIKAEDKSIKPDVLGLKNLPKDNRIHVSVQNETGTAKEGALFATSALSFTASLKSVEEKKVQLKNTSRLALVIKTDATVNTGLASLGGERRLVSWQTPTKGLPSDTCPEEIIKAIKETKRCRIILLTPAYFEKGHAPTWLEQHCMQYSVTLELKAATVNRSQVVSGWDFANRRPKPTRRLAPAGSVFFYQLDFGDDKKDDKKIDTWIDSIWMKNISDDAKETPADQNRRDGFGLAVLGTWEGLNHA
jgi:CRISPR-associated protein Cmr3